MPPLRPPKLNDEQLVKAIALAPEETVRAVLRALTGDGAFKSRIATLMVKKPLGIATTAAGNPAKYPGSDAEAETEKEETEEEVDESEENEDEDEDQDKSEEDGQGQEDGEGQKKVKSEGDQKA
ncbi:hypothetical protein SMACR_08940 [Sordaria macrospora]|uniref:WGS project CABT00000000 data, contig 2.70 n=2 Tax=Sordaria macrospora TaxID=5147 RepID=F7WB62_SORMK|nr:uncharacterized protein SMAC_08940 [Sordaria macrospora k-hell]KAA8631095.1 hypothetical protein SMACR_08940 [Sordaria macrospora]KAH7629324.1 hypothetical protein B0T09DRAFT_308351 [Sordaria sp. MPI-SDFR-AT-0083]WPJ63930.1 hypothetical protein SMAC4_08940 [Sordaria macrospora]CCC14354.1 unnamed protein product [Sordaria macrospora k-hell]